nr:hypothetical protein GCM10020092_044930 [Actinoplanes digitatis]
MHRRLWIVALAALAALAAPFAAVAPARAAVTPVAKINFQPAASTVPAGYTADTGLAFDAARGSGWVVAGTHDPLDLTRNTRDRARARHRPAAQHPHPPPVRRRRRHRRRGDAGRLGVRGADGTYQVTVAVGDRAPYDSSHTIRAEGVAVVSGFVSTAAAEFRTATATVPVSDGSADPRRGRRHQHQAELCGDRPGRAARDAVLPDRDAR